MSEIYWKPQKARETDCKTTTHNQNMF